MFAPGASIASASLRQGTWVTASQSFDAWLAGLRADARLIRDGKVRSHNIDYFTLIRDRAGDWKFVNGSYTTKPAQE